MGSDALKIEVAEWSEEAAAVLSAAVCFCPVADLEAQAKAGAVLFRVTNEAKGDLVGFYLLRIDRTASGSEGVLVAAAGRDGAELSWRVLPYIERQFSGVKSIRIHTARPGMARKLARAGYNGAEIVLRKTL